MKRTKWVGSQAAGEYICNVMHKDQSGRKAFMPWIAWMAWMAEKRVTNRQREMKPKMV